MSFLSNLTSGLGAAAGVYYSFNTSASTPNAANTTNVLVVGTGSDGVVNQPYYTQDPTSTAQVLGSKSSLLPSSALRAIEVMTPELQQFVVIRVADGTQTNAAMSAPDTLTPTAGSVLTFIAQRPGTNANLGANRIDIVSGSLIASPVLRVTLGYPSGAEIFDNIVAYAVAGGAYDPATFKLNATNLINGKVPNSSGSANWLAAGGSSTATPLTATQTLASGGTDGATGVTDAMLLGTPSPATGIYAGHATGYAAIVAQLNTPSSVATALQIAYGERPGILVFHSLPMGTAANVAPQLKASSNLADDALIVCWNWDFNTSPVAGYTAVEPAFKVCAGIMSIDPYKSPLNKPKGGAVGIAAKEFATVGQGDAGNLKSAGIMYYTNQLPASGGTWRLAHQHASSGTNVADTRMKFFLGSGLGNLLGELLGEDQASDSTDDTSPQGVRFRAQAKLDALGAGLIPPPSSSQPRQLDAYRGVCTLAINPPAGIQLGQLEAQIFARTLTGVEIILVAMAVGNAVIVQDQSTAS